jgi:hypothetical protein
MKRSQRAIQKLFFICFTWVLQRTTKILNYYIDSIEIGISHILDFEELKKKSKQFSYLWPLVLQMFLFVFIVLPLCRWSYISKPWTLYVHYFDTMVDILERPCGGNLVRNLPKSSNSSNTIFECNLWNDSFLAYIVRNSRTIACLIWLELIL